MADIPIKANTEPSHRHRHRRRKTLFLILIVLLLVGTLMPGSTKAQIESHLWAGLPWSGLAHFVLFAAISGQPVYGKGFNSLWRPVALAAFLATTTEVLQSWIPGRHPLLRDVGIDMCGALAGLALRQVLPTLGRLSGRS